MDRRNFLKTAGVSAAFGLAPAGFTQVLAQQGRTLVVAAPGTPEALDPDVLRGFTQHAVTQIYENLTRFPKVQRDGRTVYNYDTVEGHLAEKWTVSEDGKVYVFKLREGVRSFYNNELTAADVEWSWARSIDMKRTGLFIANGASVDSVTAKSKYEVEFKLKSPNALLLPLLSIYVPGIIDSTEAKKHVAADDKWATKWIENNSAGFGAYHLESLKAGEQATWVANPKYFGEKPYFTRIIVRAIPSPAARATLLKGRSVQWIPQPPPQQVEDLMKDKNIRVESAPGRNLVSIRMNTGIKPFDDVRVRKAFNHAIDRERIRKAVFLSAGELAKTMVPPLAPGSDPTPWPYEYNLAKARELLKEASVENLRVELNYTDEWWWPEPVSIQIADMMKEVGVTVVPTKITAAESRARSSMARLDLPFFCFEESPIILDPVYALVVAAQSTGVSNRVKYKNDKLDAMVEEAKRTLDRDKRIALALQAQRMWVADAPWIPLVYPNTNGIMSTNVGGWVPEYIERWADLRSA